MPTRNANYTQKALQKGTINTDVIAIVPEATATNSWPCCGCVIGYFQFKDISFAYTNCLTSFAQTELPLCYVFC